jgi:hypothetical protein
MIYPTNYLTACVDGLGTWRDAVKKGTRGGDLVRPPVAAISSITPVPKSDSFRRLNL